MSEENKEKKSKHHKSDVEKSKHKSQKPSKKKEKEKSKDKKDKSEEGKQKPEKKEESKVPENTAKPPPRPAPTYDLTTKPSFADLTKVRDKTARQSSRSSRKSLNVDVSLAEITEMQDKLEKAQKSVSLFEENVKRLEIKIEEKENELKDVKQQLQAKEDESGVWKIEKENLHSAKTELEKLKNDSLADRNSLTSEIENMKSQLNSVVQEKEKHLENWKQAIAEKKEIESKLELALNEGKTAGLNQGSEIETLKSQITSLIQKKINTWRN